MLPNSNVWVFRRQEKQSLLHVWVEKKIISNHMFKKNPYRQVRILGGAFSPDTSGKPDKVIFCSIDFLVFQVFWLLSDKLFTFHTPDEFF